MSAQPQSDDFLSIDPDNLDLVCMQQPKLMRYWCRQLALARKKTAEAKNRLKLVTAEVRSAIRAEPSAFGVEKVTADSVDDALAMNSAYKLAQQGLIDAEMNEGLLEANVKALSSRDYQLTNCGELLKLGYWSAPRIDPNTRERYLKNKQRYADVEIAKAVNEPAPKDSKKRATK